MVLVVGILGLEMGRPAKFKQRTQLTLNIEAEDKFKLSGIAELEDMELGDLARKILKGYVDAYRLRNGLDCLPD